MFTGKTSSGNYQLLRYIHCGDDEDIAHNPIQTYLHFSLHIHINSLEIEFSETQREKPNSHLPMCEKKRKPKH